MWLRKIAGIDSIATNSWHNDVNSSFVSPTDTHFYRQHRHYCPTATFSSALILESSFDAICTERNPKFLSIVKAAKVRNKKKDARFDFEFSNFVFLFRRKIESYQRRN